MNLHLVAPPWIPAHGFNVRGKADLILVINAYNYFLSCTIRDMHMPQAYVLKNNKLDIYII